MTAKSGTPSVGQLTVIVVDDDDGLLQALRFSLELDGLHVVTHLSADTVASGDLPSSSACLVLDYRLPTANGLDLLDSLRRAGVGLPAILMTSHANIEVRSRARAMGAILLEKPLLGDTLVTAIRAAVTRRGVDPGQ